MPDSQRAAKAGDLPESGRMTVRTSHRDIALFRVHGKLFALDDACLRCGGSVSSGKLNDWTITCPNCGWEHDVRTGECTGVPALRLDSYEVEIKMAACA